MREIIKFKVWDRYHKRFCSWREATAIFIDEPIMRMGIIEFNNDELSGYSFLEYTGLEDKNGVEIYEGDLLSIPENTTIVKGIHQVYYYIDGFVTSNVLFNSLDLANKNSLNWVLGREAEVIGNIYENPELTMETK